MMCVSQKHGLGVPESSTKWLLLPSSNQLHGLLENLPFSSMMFQAILHVQQVFQPPDETGE